jgi:hypothetical protein
MPGLGRIRKYRVRTHGKQKGSKRGGRPKRTGGWVGWNRNIKRWLQRKEESQRLRMRKRLRNRRRRAAAKVKE